MENKLEQFIGANEKILWHGKPSKKCFILESIFNPMLSVVIIWLVIDLFIFTVFFRTGDETLFRNGGPIFMLIHAVLPACMYISGVIFSNKRYKNTEYMITDKGSICNNWDIFIYI